MNQVFRFDANNLPLAVNVEACIFSGPNGENKVNSTYGTYSLPISYAGSYRTIDWIENTRGFTDITVYQGTAENLFVELGPETYDFRIKSNAGFAGAGAVGDPKWW
jgi:hypothetical protein